MAIISPNEVLKLARASQLELHANEVDAVTHQLHNVLAYAQCVQKIVCNVTNADADALANYRVNVFRPDIAAPTNPVPLLQGAPAREGNFFVVPMILENG